MEWSQEKQDFARSNGWDIFSLDNRMLQIQALDDPRGVCADSEIESIRTFKGPMRDFLAIAHVHTEAANGCAFCLEAIAIVENHTKDKFEGG